jgi:hypothetical protein
VDDQAAYEHSEAYERFVERRPTLRIEAIRRRVPAWVLTLEGEWAECTIDASGGARALNIIGRPTVGGMSGLPIVTARGHAVGLVSVGSESNGIAADEQHGQPALVSCLPGWLLADHLKSSQAFLESIDAMKRSWEGYLRATYRDVKGRTR